MSCKIRCSPDSLDIQEYFGYTTGGYTFPGLKGLSFDNVTSRGGFDITGQQELQAVDFWQLERIEPGNFVIGSTGARNPVLVAINAPMLQSVIGKFSIAGNDMLRAVSLPKFTTAHGVGMTGMNISGNLVLESISLPEMTQALFTLTIQGNPKLAVLNLDKLESIASTFLCAYNDLLYKLALPSLVSALNNLDITNNYYLEHVSLPAFLPTNGKRVSFFNCALEEPDVDHVLARCVAEPTFVSGSVILNGGTNATPGAQGQLDKATLIARGVSVVTN